MQAILNSPRPRDLVLAGLLGLALVAAGYVAVQGVAGFGGWLRSSAGPDRIERALAAVYADSPQLAGLETVAPDVHARVVATVVRHVELDLGEARVVAAARETFSRWRAEAMPEAPDRVLVAYLDLATERLRELESTDPALCAAMTLGLPGDEGPQQLSPQHLQREMYVDRMLLRAREDEPASRMTRAEVQAIARGIEVHLRTTFGTAAALLDGGQPASRAEAVMVCRMGIATMEALASLGPQRTPAVVRSLFFGR
ncbi:MAG: hypothetical protein ACFCVH_08180 [Alphaproteobacteria bacterium]